MSVMKLFVVLLAVSAMVLPIHTVRADTSDPSGASDCGDGPVETDSPDGIQDAWRAWTSCQRKYRSPRIDRVQNEFEVQRECGEDFFSMADMEDCLVGKSRASEVTLQQAEKALRAAMDKWDEQDEFVRLARRRLTASGKAFVRYRAAMCSFAHSMGGGGLHLSMRENACITEQNNRRAEQLLNLSTSIPLREARENQGLPPQNPDHP
ncbi:MAG: DUF1311 domain-containing protein [Zoogloeaceae bacterium]|jgi:uncharacterized protein YecT (DUF1311 family)|nr:DUF1311 domain-containing protein [Zoogloeaceae bacterium]